MKYNISTLLLVLSIFFIFDHNILASDPQLPTDSARITVTQLSSGFDRMKEKLFYYFIFSNNKKAEYQMNILEKRLAELEYAVDDKGDIETVASRYSTHLGRLTGFVIQNKALDRKEDLLSTYKRHIMVIEKLQKKVDVDSGWWIAIQHDINSLRIFSGQLNNLVE